MEYGKRLNPERSLRTPKGIKGTRQKVIVTHNQSEIDQNQELLVRFPNFSTDGCTENCIKLRINAGNKDATNAQDKVIADAYGNKFIIPLDFEMLDSAAPYYQAGLGNRLCYKLTFNDYNRVTKSGVSSPKAPDAKYKITDISSEYEIATQPDLVRSIRSEYQHMALLYDRILRHRKIIVNKSDTVWNWAFNMPCKLLKGILVLSLWKVSQINYMLKE